MSQERPFIAALLTAHIALVPLVVQATNWSLGYQDALTPSNQATWTPIIAAQLILLSAYLAFGRGPTRHRMLLFLVGCFAVLVLVVVSYSMLSTIRGSIVAFYVGQLRINSLWVTIPPAASGLLMLLARPWYGEVRLQSDSSHNQNHSLLDILLITTLVCVATAWFSYVANIHVEAANADRIADIVPIIPLFIYAARNIPLVMSAAWLVLSDRFRFFALGAYLATTILLLPDFSVRALVSYFYVWVVVFATLAVFRRSGYRLLRE